MINIILPIVLAMLAGVCKAAADIMQHHFDTSIFSKYKSKFFNIDGSNKYKNGDPAQGRKYLAMFDGFTDAWHVASNSVPGLLLILALLPVPDYPLNDFLDAIITYFVLWILFIETFNLFYNHIFKLNK